MCEPLQAQERAGRIGTNDAVSVDDITIQNSSPVPPFVVNPQLTPSGSQTVETLSQSMPGVVPPTGPVAVPMVASLSDSNRAVAKQTRQIQPKPPAQNQPGLIQPGQIQQPGHSEFTDLISSQTEQLTSRESIGPSIKIGVMLGILSLAPAIILMTTCYVRLIVVLTLLRQAFGAQQLPPTQVLTALSVFITLLVMAPVWNEIKTEAIDPYTQSENGISWDEAVDRGSVPIKRFMSKQIRLAKNEKSVALFYEHLPDNSHSMPSDLEDVPLNVLLPAFLISELKVAFLLGFQIFLPFLILDLVVSSVTVSMGMMMLPPTMVSFPLKLILFVMVDGWNLVIGMLLQSFGPFT